MNSSASVSNADLAWRNQLFRLCPGPADGGLAAAGESVGDFVRFGQ